MSMSDEEALAFVQGSTGTQVSTGMTDEQAMQYAGVGGGGKKPPRGGDLTNLTDEQAMAHAQATYGGAIGTSFTGGFKQSVGGGMEATGDILAPPDESLGDAFTRSQSKGVSPIGAIQAAADFVREKATRAIFPEGGAVNEFGKNLQGAGAELGDAARLEQQVATPDGLGFLGQAGLSIANSAGQMAPWIAVRKLPGAVTRRIGAVSDGFAEAGALGQFGSMQFGQTYNEAKAAGAAPEDALKAALVSGAAEIAGEKLGLDTLLKGGAGWFKKFLAQEIGGEEMTTIVQSLVEKDKYNPEKWSSPDEVLHDLALTAVAAAGGAGVIGGVEKGLNKITQIRAEQSFENSGARKELDRIFTDAANQLMGKPEKVELPDSPLTPEESAHAAILKKQIAEGLNIEPNADGLSFGAKIDSIIGSNQAEGRTIAGEPEAASTDEGGVSDYVLAGRERRYQPNALPASQRPIRFSSDENVVGLTLAQTGELPQGSVVAVGGTEDVFPTEVYAKVTADLTEWVKKYMPEARIVLNLEQFAPEHQGTAFGLHQAALTKGGWLHVITPRDLPSFKYQGGDYKTQVAMLTALSHEFGHALKVQSLFGDVTRTSGADIANQLLTETKEGRVSPETLAALQQTNPEVAGLVGEWASLRAAVMDRTLTAQEFMDRWAGVRKLGVDNYKTVASHKNLYTWARERLAETGKTLESASAWELVTTPYKGVNSPEAQAYAAEWLSLDEYMAEQFSRAAYVSGDIENSKTGGLFHNALAKLRQLFRDLKAEKVIAPGTTFQNWLDAQTRRAKESTPRDGKFTLTPQVKAARTRLKKRLAAEQEALLAKVEKEEEVPEPPPEQVPVPEDVVAHEIPTQERLLAMADQMERDGTFYGDPRWEKIALAGLRTRIKRGQLEEAEAIITKHLGDSLHWDREYTSKAFERLPDKEKIMAETLRATINMQDIKQKEREMWEGFLAEHPEGFTQEEAYEALISNVMILTPQATDQWASYGTDRVGLNDKYAYPSTIIWQAPTLTSDKNHFKDPRYTMHARRVDWHGARYITELQSDLFQHMGEKQRNPVQIQELEDSIKEDQGHVSDVEEALTYAKTISEVDANEWWNDIPGLFNVRRESNSHLRVWDQISQGPMQLQIELERELERSQIRIRENELTIAQMQKSVTPEHKLQDMKKTWLERLIREEVAAAHEDGKLHLFFPTADTVAKVEGWPVTATVPELEGKHFIEKDGFEWVMTGKVELDASPDSAGLEATRWSPGSPLALQSQVFKVWILASDNAQAAEIIAKAKEAPGDYGDMQGIYDRYKKDMAKFLKREFNANEVTNDGHSWLHVRPGDYSGKVLNWDKENPVQPPHPEITLDSFAGLTPEEFRKPAMVAQASEMWNRLGTESPFFRRWGGKTKVLDREGKPAKVWRGTGNKVTYLDPTTRGKMTGVGSAKKAFWFAENQLNAAWYADMATVTRKRVPRDEYRRRI